MEEKSMRIIKSIMLMSFLGSSYLLGNLPGEGQTESGVKPVIAGSSNNGSLEYAYVFVHPNNTVRIAAENLNEKGEANITFSSNGPMTPGITHELGTAEIVLKNAGVYQVNYIAVATLLNTPENSGAEARIALFLNGQRVEETEILIPPSSQIFRGVSVNDKCSTSMQAIITINAGDALTVKYLGSNACGGFLAIAHHSMIIKQLASD